MRLSIEAVGRGGLKPAVVSYLQRELDYLRLSVLSVAGPPKAELIVMADTPTLAFDYAARRVQKALRTVGFDKVRCELLDVTVHLRPL